MNSLKKINTFIICFLSFQLYSQMGASHTSTIPCHLELLDVELRSSLIEVANLRLSLNSTDQSASDQKAHIYLERLAQLKNRFDSLEFAPKEFDSLFLEAIVLVQKLKEDPKTLKTQKLKKQELEKQRNLTHPLKDRTPQVVEAIESALNKPKEEITWDDLKKITQLHLDKKNIDQLQPNDLLGLKNLTLIDLSNNHIKEIPINFFQQTFSLKVILLDDNQISILRSDTFNGLSQVQEINLSDNKIEVLPENLFHGLKNLHYLRLCNNLIQIVPEKLLKGLYSLWHLYLAGNQIQSLPAKLLSSTHHLTILNLYHNQLSQLPNGFFKKCSDIVDVFLGSNKFTHFPRAYYKPLSKLFRLWLQDNPLVPLEQRRLKHDLASKVAL